jgi:hypothetical protein
VELFFAVDLLLPDEDLADLPFVDVPVVAMDSSDQARGEPSTCLNPPTGRRFRLQLTSAAARKAR